MLTDGLSNRGVSNVLLQRAAVFLGSLFLAAAVQNQKSAKAGGT